MFVFFTLHIWFSNLWERVFLKVIFSNRSFYLIYKKTNLYTNNVIDIYNRYMMIRFQQFLGSLKLFHQKGHNSSKIIPNGSMSKKLLTVHF